MEVKIVKLDTFETVSGRMFPSHVAQRAIEDVMGRTLPLYLYGSERDLSNIIGTIKNLRIENEYLVGDAHFLDSHKVEHLCGNVSYGIEAIVNKTEEGDVISEAKFCFFQFETGDPNDPYFHR